MMTSGRNASGFTLLELMIVVAVIAVLTAIAVPQYRQYVLRGHRTDATRALQDLASREESYFFTNNVYTASMTSLGMGGNNTYTLPTNDYSLQVASASSTDYTAEADAIGTQTADTMCLSFTLNKAGVQGITAGTGTPAQCWGSQ